MSSRRDPDSVELVPLDLLTGLGPSRGLDSETSFLGAGHCTRRRCACRASRDGNPMAGPRSEHGAGSAGRGRRAAKRGDSPWLVRWERSLVPKEQIHAARRCRLRDASGVRSGFELFDTAGWGRSTFRGEGELPSGSWRTGSRRTIKAMAAVTHARVHLVLPERRLFSER